MFSLKSYSKEELLLKITCLAWLAGKIITWKVWISDRLFPIIPVLDCFPEFSNTFHSILFAFSLLGLMLIFLFPEKKYLFGFFFFIEIFSCLLDQMRWQPWEYQYMLLFLFFIFYKKNTSQFLELLTFMLAFTYILSGIHKFNGGFLHNIWRGMILHRFFHFDKNLLSNTYIHYSGLILAFIEFALGIGLLLLRKKKIIALLAIAMHLFLLLLLGPLGINYNPSVWPWNLALILFLVVLFWNSNEINISYSFLKNKFNFAVFILIGVMPCLGLMGFWDGFLSFKVYPGNSKLLVLYTKNIDAYPELAIYKSKKKFLKKKDGATVNLGSVVMRELKVAIYSEERIYVKIKREWDEKFPEQKNEFYICEYPFKSDNIKKIP